MRSDKPVVGAIHGYAVGGGFEWLLQLRPGGRRGRPRRVLPRDATGPSSSPAASPTSCRWPIGYQRAMELMLLGERQTAVRLESLGIVNRVVPTSRHDRLRHGSGQPHRRQIPLRHRQIEIGAQSRSRSGAVASRRSRAGSHHRGLHPSRHRGAGKGIRRAEKEVIGDPVLDGQVRSEFRNQGSRSLAYRLRQSHTESTRRRISRGCPVSPPRPHTQFGRNRADHPAPAPSGSGGVAGNSQGERGVRAILNLAEAASALSSGYFIGAHGHWHLAAALLVLLSVLAVIRRLASRRSPRDQSPGGKSTRTGQSRWPSFSMRRLSMPPSSPSPPSSITPIRRASTPSTRFSGRLPPRAGKSSRRCSVRISGSSFTSSILR